MVRSDAGDKIKGFGGTLEMKEKAGGVGVEEKRGIEGGILSFEDKELKKEQKVEEQQGRRRLQPVFCFHKMTTVTSHSILACTKENCEENNHKKTQQNHTFQEKQIPKQHECSL